MGVALALGLERISLAVTFSIGIFGEHCALRQRARHVKEAGPVGDLARAGGIRAAAAHHRNAVGRGDLCAG